MALIESSEVSLGQLAGYDVVLQELRTSGQTERAAAFAWAAIENISERHSARDALGVASAYLLAVGNGDDLRSQVAGLYQQAYSDCAGLEALLSEAGLAGGRPVRRAVRTLDVCLAVQEGDYLLGRHDEGAARVASVDRDRWMFTITGPDGEEALGAVHLADRYRSASADEFYVSLQFQPDALRKRLSSDPAGIVAEICRQHGNRMDTDALEMVLVPSLISESDWKRWWTKARTALRRSAHITIEGRSPCFLTYSDAPAALEEGLGEKFRRLHDPGSQLDLAEAYFRDCTAQSQPISSEIAAGFVQELVACGKKAVRRKDDRAGHYFAGAVRVGAVAGVTEGVGEAKAFFGRDMDLRTTIGVVPNDTLLILACDCVREERPDDWIVPLMSLLPSLPGAVCDHVVEALLDAGQGREAFEPVIEAIMALPVAHFDALLWLWDGPAREEALPVPARVTLLSRVVRGLDNARRDESLPKSKAKRISQRARAVLSARRYERFDQCAEQLDGSMANALYTQMGQLDNLGRAVRDDLMKRLGKRFASQPSEPVEPWLREDVLYVSRGGMAKKQTEIDHHVNVKMRENAKAIGDAAEKGDLSENSEYKFALEERDLLRARLAQMNAEMALAEIFASDEVPKNHVGIGSKVSFRRTSDGARYTLSLVGPWDAVGEKQWINYKTPLAQRVLGKHVGDVVQFEHSSATGEYEIVELDNAMDELSTSRAG